MQLSNGDVILSGLSDNEWEMSTEGAFAVYGENTSFCQDLGSGFDVCDETLTEGNYGKLYNWHVVNDGRGVCPSGWVSQVMRRFVLTAGLGGDEIAGDLLKSQVGWPLQAMDVRADRSFPRGTRLLMGVFIVVADSVLVKFSYQS